ncbi:NAD-dependent epimerase/dehydratase family protein [Maribacter sp. HTCC2170]|uniref:NAD-dependent epimerase/dehydratase family protein n=1 Tax=Maribacter sp. (strain HTCC2170 / KCCM 42371) TaxID=313603 RepID=UPI00006B8582|nr:NAD-dependent epimerase/dehydratase family protein [Maribacter sp. HTCC2170]EAQ99897.1 3-beta hydroxysteroid dehydrogenase/isomerase family protein [Maribacter sp. HTCC2170]
MILVTGGTGLVGAHLLLNLVQNNNVVRAIHRFQSNLEQVEKIFSYYTENASDLFNKIEWFQADINDIPAMEIAFKDVDYVYHSAALISFDPNDYRELKKINAIGTANIVNLCLSNKVKKLCYVSTIGAIGKSTNDQEATEENEWNGQEVNVYALTKHRAEMEVWRGSQEGLVTVIINPGVIIGPGFWNSGSGKFFTTANKEYSFYPPGGTGFITVGDVVKMMKRLMDSDITNQRFIAVSENLTFQDILTRISKELGRKGPTKELKIWQLKIARSFDYLKHLVLKSKRKITKKTIHSLVHRDIYDNQKIINTLDFKFEDLDKVITLSCKKFKEDYS